MWLLLIEDDVRVADMLKHGLEEEGYAVDLASDGEEGESLALLNAYDALIVDWRLPKKDGKTVVQDLRATGHTVPILMLTVRADINHRVAGLDAGAGFAPSTSPPPWLPSCMCLCRKRSMAARSPT